MRKTVMITQTPVPSLSKATPVALLIGMLALASVGLADKFAASLPDGVKPVRGLDRAQRDATPTRERICINGLWRWQPAVPEPDRTPVSNWGFFKVPGCWPGITGGIETGFHSHRKAQFVMAVSGVLMCEAEGGIWIVPPQTAIWIQSVGSFVAMFRKALDTSPGRYL
jgi:hypothetical protein